MLNIPSALRCLFYLKCYSDFTGTEHSTMCDCIVFTSLRELWNKQYYTIIELKVKLVWGKKLTSNLQCTSNMSNMTWWKCIKMQMCVYLYMILNLIFVLLLCFAFFFFYVMYIWSSVLYILLCDINPKPNNLLLAVHVRPSHVCMNRNYLKKTPTHENTHTLIFRHSLGWLDILPDWAEKTHNKNTNVVINCSSSLFKETRCLRQFGCKNQFEFKPNDNDLIASATKSYKNDVYPVYCLLWMTTKDYFSIIQSFIFDSYLPYGSFQILVTLPLLW